MIDQIPDVKKSWTHAINVVTVGATQAQGGTRTSTVTVGGETTLPFYHFEGKMPNAPVVAMEVWDVSADDWPDSVKEPFADVLADPGAWAKKCVDEFGAQLVCLRLKGCADLLPRLRPSDHRPSFRWSN